MDLSLSPTVTLTPALDPPHPSLTPTLHNSHSYLQVLASLDRHRPPSVHQGSFPRRNVKSSHTPQRDGLSLVYSQSSVPSSQALPKPIIVTTREKPGIFFKPKTIQVDGIKKPTASVKFPTPFNHKTKQGSSTVQTKLIAQASTNKMTVSKPPRPPQLSTSSSQTQSPLQDVRRMSSEERSQLEASLSGVEEVAACLVFTDGSSQLRPTVVKGKVACPGVPTVQGLCLSYAAAATGHANEAPRLSYLFIPLTMANESLFSWCRGQLRRLLQHSRVIVYGGQRMVATVISCLDILEHSNEWLHWKVLDLLVAEWLLDPDHPPESFAQVMERCKLRKPPTTSESTTDLCGDVSLLGPAMVCVYQRLREENLWLLFERIEIKAIPILAGMEVAGIQVSANKLLGYAELLKIKISRVEEVAYKAAGHKFSINSTAQLREVLFEELHLDSLYGRTLSKTQVNKVKSTSESVLNQLKELHPLPGLVLEYRQLCKINATYIAGVLPYISRDTLKASWQHTGTATGRLVSCNPNIQAFPKQSINLGVVKKSFIVGKEPEEVTIDIRETVESRPGFTFIAADFKSIELRLVAHFSKDDLLLSILNSNATPDVFVHLASEWLGVAVDAVSPVHRERTKRVVYAVVYGVGKERLAEILNVEPSYAKDLTSSFLSKFPGVRNFIHKTIEECRSKGYLVSICGRRRWFPSINSDNHQLRLHTERQAVNFVVQALEAVLRA
ncbi:DNA polymerase nu-like isoform X2 [Halichondria panicea]|uniref:DNA polymerase nu-like isoform X2 n=1 Tax=Halichondria panicea TaxID=6063 RepID=UPI00312BAE42